PPPPPFSHPPPPPDINTCRGSSAASDVYKRQRIYCLWGVLLFMATSALFTLKNINTGSINLLPTPVTPH
ncbi:hypothetical protein, partial [Pedobacter sp. ASV12]|uniref:hypothetical protein n=1 Tax=Pedobacter sp. ASV12 TaxID=2795120 RepID=UPI0018ED4BFA